MRRHTNIIKAILIAVFTGTFFTFPLGAESGNIDTDDPVEMFAEGNRAYNEGRFDEAISKYERILETGHVSAELHFNLGNAYFRNGRPGKAVLHYKYASYLDPRDADIAGNIRYAMQITGAIQAEPGLLERAARFLSAEEWIAVSTASYWLLFISLGISSAIAGRKRSIFRRMAVIFAAIMFAGLTGVWHWMSFSLRPEVVVVKPGQEVLFAPLEGATVHFGAPEGTVGQLLDRSGNWIRIAVGGNRGWIMDTAAEPVYPVSVTRTSI